MIFEISERAKYIHRRVTDFMEEYVAPNAALYRRQIDEGDRWESPAIMEEWKQKAKQLGLWNLFLPDSEHGAGLSNLEYASIAEILGRYPSGGEMFNCSAPDTGNMEILQGFASAAVKERWLAPLLAGEIRSSYLMTEPDVASSDATNVSLRIRREGDEYVLDGRKWWSSGAMHRNAKVSIVMGCTDPDAPPHQRQSQIVVPHDTPGFRIVRTLDVMGYDHAPGGHCEIELEDVRVPVDNILLGEGRGFEIAQARLGPGRIHHCMRCIGAAEVALELMIERARRRVAFGTPLIEKGSIRQDIARSRIEIDQARLMVLHTAHMMDTVGNRAARREIAAIKVIAPKMACDVIDRAMQVHGGAGMCQDTPLPEMWAYQRSLRFADGPDEVHMETVCKQELRHYRDS